MIPIEFNEEEDFKIPSSLFNQESALTIYNDYKNKISIDFPNPINHFCYVLRSNGYVGQVPINDEYLLIIKPKVSIQNIFSMLEYAYNLKSIQFLDGIAGYDSIDDVLEYLASIFAKMVINRYKKGLYQSYIEKLESMSYIRGRMDVKSTSSALINKSTKIECEYDELTTDLIDNKILAWTLYRLLSYDIKKQEVRREIRHAYRALSGRVEITQIETRDCIYRMYNQLNKDYKIMHSLCRLFLEHSGPIHKSGNNEFIPFILDMSVLFETFVAEWLKLNLPDNIEVKTQHKVHLDNDGILKFRIDLVLIDIPTGRVLAVLDTKYKRPNVPSESDIAQIMAYAIRMNTKKAFLVYPSCETKIMNFQTGNIDVGNLIFDINKNSNIAGNIFIETLLEKI